MSTGFSSTSCTPCPVGRYLSNNLCVPYPPGKYLNKTAGASDASECVRCQRGKVSAFAGAGCEGCGAGLYCSDKCFSVYLEPAGWNAAQTKCLRSGCNLAAMNSWEENQAIQLSLKNNQSYSIASYWVGFRNSTTGWSWIDGSTNSYTAWGAYEPLLRSNGTTYAYINLSAVDASAVWFSDTGQATGSLVSVNAPAKIRHNMTLLCLANGARLEHFLLHLMQEM